MDDSAQARAPVSRREAFAFWFKLGCIGFGGPAGQIALMHAELVQRRRWISEKRFMHALHYCMLLPGPEAQQLATYIGWLMHRTWGGVVAGVLFVLPSLFILIALSWLYMAYGQLSWVAGVFYGIQPAVTAIVLQAAVRIGGRALHTRWHWAIACASFLAITLLGWPFPLIVAAAALAGYLGGRLAPQAFGGPAPAAPAQPGQARAWLDDDSPPPAHTRFSWTGLRRVLLAGLLLWGMPMGLLCGLYGWDHALTQMGWFFTKAALLTFGGAYAVLPYVHQGAVEHYAWLSSAQMMDGLALGESTPGPLIMVVAFVGYVAGHARALFGPEALFLAGAVAACVVTWFTFLPSFLFILAGGPLVESTQQQIRLTAPLGAITAAVVGVILNLALFFAQHIFWPDGLAGRVDTVSVLIALAAGLALWRLRWSVLQVLLASALVGLLLVALR